MELYSMVSEVIMILLLDTDLSLDQLDYLKLPLMKKQLRSSVLQILLNHRLYL